MGRVRARPGKENRMRHTTTAAPALSIALAFAAPVFFHLTAWLYSR